MLLMQSTKALVILINIINITYKIPQQTKVVVSQFEIFSY